MDSFLSKWCQPKAMWLQYVQTSSPLPWGGCSQAWTAGEACLDQWFLGHVDFRAAREEIIIAQYKIWVLFTNIHSSGSESFKWRSFPEPRFFEPQITRNALDQADDGEVLLREKEKQVHPFLMFNAVDHCAPHPPLAHWGKTRAVKISCRILRLQIKVWLKYLLLFQENQNWLICLIWTNLLITSDIKPWKSSAVANSCYIHWKGTQTSRAAAKGAATPQIPSVGQDQTLSPGSKS